MEVNSPTWFVTSQQAKDSLQRSAFIPALVFTVLAFLIVVLRWYSKLRLMQATWRLEDFLITAAMLLSLSMTAVAGIDFARDATPSEDESAFLDSLAGKLKLVFAESLIYQLGTNLVKATLLVQYLRVFGSITYFRTSCYTIFALILGESGWGVLGFIFLCNPVRTYWDVRVDGRCMSIEHHFLSSSIVGIVLDWAIWILPMPVVGRLNLPRHQRWGLWIVFGLGGFVCMVGILRLTLVLKALDEGRIVQSGTYAVVWSTVELNVAIICASLLVMKPLLAKWLPTAVSERRISASEDRRVMNHLTGS